MVKEIEVSKGAKYFELNVSNKRNMNFWLKQGFNFNGIDDYGSVKLTTKKDDILLINVDENNWTELTSLKLILDYLYVEGRYENVEVCVKKEDVNAIKLYKKIGFINTGYIDPNVEDAYNLVFSFMDLDAAIQANRGSVIR